MSGWKSSQADQYIDDRSFACTRLVPSWGPSTSPALGRDAAVVRLGASTDRVRRLAGAVLVLAGLFQLWFFLFRFNGLEMLGL